MTAMALPAKPFLFALVLSAVVLAGCSGGSPNKDPDAQQLAEEAPQVEATDTTGGIRGIVVDEAIRPIAGAKIEIGSGADLKKTETDGGGLFAISGLDEGTYFLKVSHPLFATAQQSVDVEAGVKEPKPIKVQLIRQVFAEPFLEQLTFDGFIICSANIILVAYSEECGEGAGVPCTMPPVPCGRVGGQDGNNVQFDYVIHPGFASSVIEIVWKPTSEAGKAFFAPVSTEWVCDPFCGGDRIFEFSGVSPLLGRFEADADQINKETFIYDESPITVFTWAEMNEGNPTAAVLLNQKYQEFVTNFYYVPAPEGWSFVQGSPDPFK